MKHLYLEQKFINHNNQRSGHAIKRRKAIKKRSRGASGKNPGISEAHGTKKHFIKAPTAFSIIKNPKETQHFFDQLASLIDRKWPIYVDLSAVANLTPDAVLTLLALLDRASNLDIKTSISGNAPNSPLMRKIFLHSGFYKYVNSVYQHEESDDILSVESGENVQPTIAGAVVKFARKKLGLSDKRLTSGLYTTIMETMINVPEHAYGGRRFDKWYLMALYADSCNRIQFAMVDSGKGIPSTVRRKFTDAFGTDANILVSTLNGEERTQTKKTYRGYGLPKVKGYAEQGRIENLFVVSRHGFYDVSRSVTENLDSPYNGTLIAWDFIPEKCNDNQSE